VNIFHPIYTLLRGSLRN